MEAARRSNERRAQLGGQIKAMRTRRRWTQKELGRRADLGRLVIGRAERGEGSTVLETMDRIGIALGVPLAVGFDRDVHEDVADAGHLAVQETLLRIGRGAGYARQFELPTRPDDPWRSIDVVLTRESGLLAIACECWNTFGDVGSATRASRRKAAELEQLAVARWGSGARARLVWVVRESTRNRALIARYPEVFASQFTGSSHGWVAALTHGVGPPEEPGLVWCDVATGQLHAWHRRRSSGRESTGSGS